MPLGWLQIIMLIAAGQGLLLGVLILHKHGDLYANRFIATLILMFSLILVDMTAEDLNWYDHSPVLGILLLGCTFLTGPLLFFYVRSMVFLPERVTSRDLVHLIPFVLVEIGFLLHILTGAGDLSGFVGAKGNSGMVEGFVPFNWLIILYVYVYVFASLSLLKRHRERIKRVFSNTASVRMAWLRNMTLSIAVTLGFFASENALLLFDLHISPNFALTSFLTAGSVYAIGYLALYKSEVFCKPEVSSSFSLARAIEEARPAVPSAHVEAESEDARTRKYEKSGLSEERAEEIKTNLLQIMRQDCPYRDPALTLDQLASQLDVTPHNLSEVINTRLGLNFFDFINGYRVEQVKQDLLDTGKQNLKVLAIAFDAGFNSKSSFNALFKKFTGLTPSQYREQKRMAG